MKTHIAAAFLCIAMAGTAQAEGNPVVVELFTSQGCSSCPPADEMMHSLAKRDDVIGLALHVDYWDYIGWKDEFASPAHTLRQRAYAREGGRGAIYTPQMVVNGREDVVGAKAMELMDLIDAHRNAPPMAQVAVETEGATLRIQVTPAQGQAQAAPYDVQVVQYTPLRHASIKRGELAGHDLDYANVVESWHIVGRWDGTTDAAFTATVDPYLPAAILVQRVGHGPIVAAAKVE